ncbi:shikimate dehydrogenase [mine drainage metagenome]|uniref:shikimate dehydrogenase (NADP(+)) n=1 Tax=mine drainage metagenome TaxID=410659 RepID=A0A1J5SRQ9_9ZZZZ
MTDRYAVIGNPIAHSQSPRIHALFAQQTGQDIAYGAILAPRDGFAATVFEFIAAGGRGANVTLPFKEEAYRLAASLSPRARSAGAANTLDFSGATIFGDNTDGAGLVRDLVANLDCPIAASRVLLLGAGGAARGALLPLLQQAPALLVIANRSADKARRLAREFSAADAAAPLEGCGFADLAGRQFDLVIDATSAGLTDTPLELPPGLFAPDGFAYEMIYGRQTAFQRLARAGGAARVADGLGMLVEQAAESFLLWRGVRPQTGPVLARLRRELTRP